jgi:hypothetical protein
MEGLILSSSASSVVAILRSFRLESSDLRLDFAPSHRRRDSLVEDGFEEAAAFDLSRVELLFQPVAQRHQLFDLGDDAVLFGERWQRDQHLTQP